MRINFSFAGFLFLIAIASSAFSQTTDKFSIQVLQGKDTLDFEKGLKNYEPLRVFWTNKTSERIKSVEVHFGNGQLPFTNKTHKLGKGQKLIVVDVPQFRTIDQMDMDSPRKREAEFSRIVIVFMMESEKYFSFAIPFKLQDKK